MRDSAQARTIELLVRGIAAGFVALAVVSALTALRRIVNVQRIPILGVAVVVFTAVLATTRRSLPETVLLGVGLLLVLPLLTPRRPDQRWRVLASIPGAAVLAFAAPAGEGGLELVTLFAIPILGGLVATFDEANSPPSLAAIGMAAATGAAFMSLPDTQNIASMAGITTVMGAGALVLPRLALGASVYPWMGLLIWIATADGSARPAAVVGTIGAMAILVIEPALRVARRQIHGLLNRPISTSGTTGEFLFAGAQGTVAVLSARLAGTRRSTWLALAIVTGLWLVVAGGLLAVQDGETR